jgi:hypothetical protein
MDWINLAKDMKESRAVLNTTMHFLIPEKTEFLA